MSTTSPPSFESKYHPEWNDPTADMIIEVTNGTRFRVHSQTMRLHSAFFRDMPENSRELCGDSQTAVHLEANSWTMGVLLSFLKTRVSRDWDRLLAATDLGARYHFDMLEDLVTGFAMRELAQGGMHHSFEIFIFAAKQRLPNLAQDAIRCFEHTRFSIGEADYFYPMEFKDIPGEYTAALFIAMMRCPLGHSGTRDWLAVADAFCLDH